MLLTITTTHRPSSDLGYLLHKRPDRFQSFEQSFGKAHVFYPVAGEERCTACLLLDVDALSEVSAELVPHGVEPAGCRTGKFRHADHRFEWTRKEFQDWANGIASRFGYSVRFVPVGPEHPELGSPTQMGVFELY